MLFADEQLTAAARNSSMGAVSDAAALQLNNELKNSI